MSTTGRNLVRGSTMRLLAKLVNMAVGLVMMPIIIRHLGDRHYGIWVLTATYLGFSGLFDLGITSAVSRFLSRALGSEDEDDFQRVFATSLCLLSGLGALVMGLAAVLALFSHQLIGNASDAHLFRWLALILGVSMGARFPARVFNALLASHLRYDLSSAVRMCEAVLRAPLVILVFHLGYGLLGLALLSAAVELLAAGATALLACRAHRGLSISPRFVDKVRAKRLLGYGAYTLVAQIADLLRFQIGPLVITVFVSVSLVTPYAIANRLTRTVGGFMVALMSVLTPVFSRQEGRGDEEAMRRTYLFTCRISTYAAVLLGGTMALLGEAFIERWLGPEYTYVTPLMYVLMVGMIFTCAQIPTVGFLYGTSRHKYYAITNMIHGIACLVLTSALIIPFGLMGVAVGTAIPTVLTKFFVQPIYACRAMRISLRQFYVRHALVNFAVPITYLTLFYLLAHSLIRPQYLVIFGIALLACIFFVPYSLFFGMKRAERKKILAAVMPGNPKLSKKPT